jgi:hypothetical protein
VATAKARAPADRIARMTLPSLWIRAAYCVTCDEMRPQPLTVLAEHRNPPLEEELGGLTMLAHFT